MKYILTLISPIVFVGFYIVMKTIDGKNYRLPKVKKSYLVFIFCVSIFLTTITSYTELQLVNIFFYFGLVSYAAFTDFHSKYIYSLPSIVCFAIGILNYFVNCYSKYSLRSMVICFVICIVLTICQVMNVGDLELLASLIPGFYVISTNGIYPLVFILFVAILLGFMLHIVKFFKYKEKTYAMAPYIMVGYIMTVMFYGV